MVERDGTVKKSSRASLPTRAGLRVQTAVVGEPGDAVGWGQTPQRNRTSAGSGLRCREAGGCNGKSGVVDSQMASRVLATKIERLQKAGSSGKVVKDSRKVGNKL